MSAGVSGCLLGNGVKTCAVLRGKSRRQEVENVVCRPAENHDLIQVRSRSECRGRGKFVAGHLVV